MLHHLKFCEFRGTVNVCLAYMSQNEIARALEIIRKGVQSGVLDERLAM